MKIVYVAIAAIFLVACGGGGGDDDVAETPDAPDIDAPEIDAAALATLRLSSGGVDLSLRLEPAFAPGSATYTVDVGLWIPQLELTATPVDARATFTIAGIPVAPGVASAPVALALGTTSIPIVVTAPTGAQRTYTVDVSRGAAVLQRAYGKASNTGNGDGFGTRIAMWGDTLAVAADGESSNATGVDGDQTSNIASSSGAVYVFVRTGNAWIQQAYLKASNTELGDLFGRALALAGDTLVVAAPYEDSDGMQGNNTANNSGAVYVFTRTGGVWSQQAYLKASNLAAGDNFGTSVAVSGDTLAVGARYERSAATGIDGDQTSDAAPASGAVYVFTRTGTVWSQQAYVKASNTGAQDAFGASVALWDDTLAVGAFNEASAATGIDGDQTSEIAFSSGAVYVFHRTGTAWAQQAYVKASNADAGDAFGWSVALWGDTLAVAAYSEASNGDPGNDAVFDAGAVYVFTRTGTAWSQQAYLKASNPGSEDVFGYSLALWGDALAVGAWQEASLATGVDGDQTSDAAMYAGAVYTFARTGTSWAQTSYLKASNTAAQDKLGTSVALWGDTVAGGAPQEDSNATGIDGDQANNSATNSGAVYVWR